MDLVDGIINLVFFLIIIGIISSLFNNIKKINEKLDLLLKKDNKD